MESGWVGTLANSTECEGRGPEMGHQADKRRTLKGAQGTCCQRSQSQGFSRSLGPPGLSRVLSGLGPRIPGDKSQNRTQVIWMEGTEGVAMWTGMQAEGVAGSPALTVQPEGVSLGFRLECGGRVEAQRVAEAGYWGRCPVGSSGCAVFGRAGTGQDQLLAHISHRDCHPGSR